MPLSASAELWHYVRDVYYWRETLGVKTGNVLGRIIKCRILLYDEGSVETTYRGVGKF